VKADSPLFRIEETLIKVNNSMDFLMEFCVFLEISRFVFFELLLGKVFFGFLGLKVKKNRKSPL
jgi:hypothetical protein